MAHMVETMAYAGEVPWHGLGVPVSNDLTPVQMMEKAGLDWKVQEVESLSNITVIVCLLVRSLLCARLMVKFSLM